MELIDRHSIIMGLSCGFILAMVVINLLYFGATKKAVFGAYSGYVIFLGLSLASINGLGAHYLWQHSPWFGQHALAIFSNVSVALSIIVFDLLLDIRSYNAKRSRALQALSIFYVLSASLSLIIPLPVFTSVMSAILVMGWSLTYVLGGWLWFKGVAIARLYTLGRSLLFITLLVVDAQYLNLFNLGINASYLLALAVAIEALLLTLVLVFKHNQQHLDLFKIQSQQLAKTLQDKSALDEILTMQERAQEELEYKMQERNLELEITLRELSEKNHELQEKNTLDALTGVRNRSYFDKKYIAEIRRSRREQTQLSIVMIDIDHFKNVNDKYGHLVGDDCIKAVALSIKNALKRPSDDLCRYGGEEFVLILPSTELSGANTLVENIRQTIEQTPVQSDGFTISLTISAGIATAIAKPELAEKTILASADQQLYQAKNAGRNKVKGIFLSDSDEQEQD